MLSASEEFCNEGIKTTHQFHKKRLKDKKFVKNQHKINYLENEFLKNA